jgi:hypothetical protein
MKKKQRIFILKIMLIISCMSCKKTDTTSPPEVSFSGCRIDKSETTQFSNVYSYNADGTIATIAINEKCANGFCNNGTTNFFYENGLLISLKAETLTENYEYSNGALSKIKVTDLAKPDYANYVITIEVDNNKRIVKMKDNKGIQTDIKRDNSGNITETKTIQISDSTELYRAELSRYDNKKTVFELHKGWRYDVKEFYSNYIKMPFFSIGASGNPLSFKEYRNKVLTADVEYTYEYSVDDYPIKETFFDKINNFRIITNHVYKNCK